MTWKNGTVTLDDGCRYEARFYVNDQGKVLNIRVHSWNCQGRADQLAYPYTYQEDRDQVESYGLNYHTKMH